MIAGTFLPVLPGTYMLHAGDPVVEDEVVRETIIAWEVRGEGRNQEVWPVTMEGTWDGLGILVQHPTGCIQETGKSGRLWQSLKALEDVADY